MTAKKDRWEVHHDPYDVSRIWVRNHWDGGWIMCFWKHLRRVPVPFGELAWDHARHDLADRGEPVTETAIADAVAALLDKASHGPVLPGDSQGTASKKAARKGSGSRPAPARRHQRGQIPILVHPCDQSPRPASPTMRQAMPGSPRSCRYRCSTPARRPPSGGDPHPGQLQDRRQPTTTLEGWRRFVDADEAAFELLPDAVWDGLEDAVQLDYDEARIAHHAEMIVVTTSTIHQILQQGRLLTLLNQREIGARRSLIVSGPAATGKTTAVKQLGRTHELRIRQRYPDGDRIPVVYVTAPPKGSPRKLAMEFARFLGLPPVGPRQNVTDITEAVCQVLLDARDDLVIVDEIHSLNLATSAGEDLSDHLRYFTEHLPATFVHAGIDVERAGLFTGTRGRQIARRAALIRTGAFPYQQEWKGLVATMERTLRLHRHQPGTLTGLDRDLHQRTGGTIGSLSHLIRAAAISAILDGSEQISKTSLEAIRVDHAAESSTRRASSRVG